MASLALQATHSYSRLPQLSMMKSNFIFIILCPIIYSAKFVNAKKSQDDEIQKLEKSKNELYNEILIAIDAGVDTLKQINDTEMSIGLSHMQELKREIKEANGTDGVFEKWIDTMNKTQNSRRSPKKELIMDILDIANVFKNKKSVKEQKKEKNTEDLRNRLNKWLADREREKARIREYKNKKKTLMAGKFEECPNFGIKKKKGVKYPCCRKCCKKSYMGCL